MVILVQQKMFPHNYMCMQKLPKTPEFLHSDVVFRNSCAEICLLTPLEFLTQLNHYILMKKAFLRRFGFDFRFPELCRNRYKAIL